MSECPEAQYHGNPLRYCPCGWMEEAPPPEPVPVLAGTFALYDDGKGGYVLVTDVGGETTRKAIPAALVKMATGNGAVSKHVRRLMGN